MHGVVLQLPSRHGREIYMAAHSDPWSDGPVAIDMAAGFFEDKEDAARAADSFAEQSAEKERDYHEASDMGNRWREHGEEAEACRAEAKTLLAEIRSAKVGPAICSTLRAKVRSLRHEAAQAAEAQRKLGNPDEYNAWWLNKYGPVFNEAAGEKVL